MQPLSKRLAKPVKPTYPPLETENLNSLPKTVLNLSVPGQRQIIHIAVLIITIIGLLHLYQTLQARETAYIKEQVNDEANKVEVLLAAQTNEKLLSLKRLAQRWEAAGGTPYKLWQADAANYTTQLKGLRAVEWVDSSYHVRWIEPLKGNEQVIGLNILFNAEREAALKGAAEKQTPTMTPPLDLVQGYKAFIAYIPMYIGNHFDGFTVGVFSINDFFGNAVNKEVTHHFAFTMQYNGKDEYQSAVQSALADATWQASKNIKLYDKNWQLKIVPTQEFVESQKTDLPNLVLLTGFVIIVLALLTIRSIRSSRLKSTYLEKINHEIKKKTEQLVHNEIRNQQLVDGVQDYAIYWLDLQGNVESWNTGAQRIKGYAAENVIHQNFSKFYTPEDQAKNLPQQALTTAVIKGKFEGEGWRVRKDGSQFWASVTISAITDSTGKATGFAKITRDISERKDFEKHLISREQRYDLAVRGMSVGVWEWNIITGEMYWSPRLQEIFGIIETDFTPDLDYFAAHLHPEDKDETLRMLAKHLDQLGAYDVEYRLKQQNGNYVWIHASGQAEWDQTGKAVRMAGSVDDVTASKLASQALVQSSTLKSAILSSSAYLIIATETDGKIITFNKAAEDALGYKASELIGRETPALWHDQNEIVAQANILSAEFGTTIQPGFEVFIVKAKKGIATATDWTFKRRDGSSFPGRLTATAIRNGDNEITGYLGIIEDITERKKSEKVLKESNDFLDLIMESIPDMVFVKDAEFRIVKANRAFLEIYPEEMRDSIIGTTTIEKFLPEDVDIFLEYDRLAFQEGSSEVIEKVTLPNKGFRYIFTKKVRFENANGEPFILAIARDISEIKHAEADRLQLMDKLMQSNSELERFAYVASHDMQEPLRMIANFSGLISDEYGANLDETATEYLGLVKDSAVRMQEMVEDLLEYSRVKSDQRSFVEVDGALELNHVLQNLSSAITEHNAVITYDDLPTFLGNPVQFMRLLQNFIGNGLKYQIAGNRPQIHVGVVDQDSHWCFMVKDNGIGISEEFSNEVFEPFKRLHAWGEYKGSGIGLAVCKQIIESHGGKVWVSSQIGIGSTFFFTIAKNQQDQMNRAAA